MLRTRDFVFALAIFLGLLGVYCASEMAQNVDSKYTLFLSHRLLNHQSFSLEPFPDAAEHYQVYTVNGRVVNVYPPGSAILSLPLYALAQAVGFPVVDSSGAFSASREEMLQKLFASFLMACTGVSIFFAARYFVSSGWAALVAVAAGLATQMWSTGSRGLWSDTWGITLLALIILHLLATWKRGPSPVLLGTMCSWLYFSRPTYSVHIVAICALVLYQHRRAVLPLGITGLVWLGAFITWSLQVYGTPLPAYYMGSLLNFERYTYAVAVNLVSPSRGWFIYVPSALWLLAVCAYWRRWLRPHSLVICGCSVFALHLGVHSGLMPCHAGHCYGARFMIGLVPWEALLAAIAIGAMLRHPQPGRAFFCGWGFIAVAVGALINGHGANSRHAWNWNIDPDDINRQPERVWDWSRAQCITGVPAADRLMVGFKIYPIAQESVELGSKQADAYLGEGWSFPEIGFRWTDGHTASFGFSLERIQPLTVTLKASAFDSQRVRFSLNGKKVQEMQPREGREWRITLPAEELRTNNILRFHLPDAKSPRSLGLGEDRRILGLCVEKIEVRTADTEG